MKQTKMALAALALIATAVACSKDDNKPLNYHEFGLTAVNNSGVTGRVKVTRLTPVQAHIQVQLDKSAKDTAHLVSLYSGTPAAPGALLLQLPHIKGTGGHAESAQRVLDSILVNGVKKPFNYDSLMKTEAFIRVHFSAYKPDSVLATGRVGKL